MESAPRPPKDHRKLISVWLAEEDERRKTEEKPSPTAVPAESVRELEELLREHGKDFPLPEALERFQREAKKIIQKGIESQLKNRRPGKLPTQYEREQRIMRFARLLPAGENLVSPNALEQRLPGESKNNEGRMFPLFPELQAILEKQRARTTAVQKSTGQIIR